MRTLEEDGYAIAAGLVTAKEVGIAARALDRAKVRSAGTRNLLDQPWCGALVQRVKARLVKAGALPASFVAVQCTVFDKTPETNWLVPFHQDLSIPVKTRIHHPALGAWSEKEGAHYVRAPVEALESLVAVRLHVDYCGPENGPLRVIPGSHREGLVSRDRAREMRGAFGEETCLVQSGDAILMRPLTLHASSKAQAPARRRVLHFLLGPPRLPHGLEWRQAV